MRSPRARRRRLRRSSSPRERSRTSSCCVTADSHDVQVDAAGVAWMSGNGARGYLTSGFARDPLTGKKRWAAPLDRIPYAGGTIASLGGAYNAAR